MNIVAFVSKCKYIQNWIKKLKDFFPESLGQKRECTLSMGTHYTWQNMVILGYLFSKGEVELHL